MNAILFVLLAANAGRLPGMRGYYGPPGLGDDDGVLFGFGYQPLVNVSDWVDDGTGWMVQFGWGMGGRAGAVVVAYEQSSHRKLDTGESVNYWRLDAGYGAYITSPLQSRAVAPYVSCGASLHSMKWGSGPDEGRGGEGGYVGMGVDFLPQSPVFFGFDVVAHFWTDKYDQGYVTVTATASVFLEF